MWACRLGGVEARWRLSGRSAAPSLTIKPLSSSRQCGVTSRKSAKRNVDADPAFSTGPTELLGAFHPEAHDGVSRGLQLRELTRGLDGRTDRCDRRAAAVDGDRHRLARHAGAGPLHVDRRRLRCVGAERQPFPDRRTRGRLHRTCGGDCAAARHGWPDPGDDPVGDHADGHRLSAARHLHQVHPLSGYGRLHRQYRGDDLLKRDQAALGLVLQRRRARTAPGEDPLPVVEPANALNRRAQPFGS